MLHNKPSRKLTGLKKNKPFSCFLFIPKFLWFGWRGLLISAGWTRAGGAVRAQAHVWGWAGAGQLGRLSPAASLQAQASSHRGWVPQTVDGEQALFCYLWAFHLLLAPCSNRVLWPNPDSTSGQMKLMMVRWETKTKGNVDKSTPCPPLTNTWGRQGTMLLQGAPVLMFMPC